MANFRLFSVTVLATVIGFGGAWAAGSDSSDSGNSGPDLAAIQSKIDGGDFDGAIEELLPLAAAQESPDVFNLLGYSYRKTGDLASAATYYEKALALDAKFKPAIEYQGEMFLQQGDVEKAKANLAKLAELCPSGCEERADLEKAIAEFKPAAATN